MSERRARAVIGADRTSMRYRSCRGGDEGLRARLRELASQRRRFGYRRLHILLRRDGVTINRKKTQRLYREEGLTVRHRKGRRCAVGARAPAPVLALPNQRWSLDVVHDQLATGRRFRLWPLHDDLQSLPSWSQQGVWFEVFEALTRRSACTTLALPPIWHKAANHLGVTTERF